MKDVKGVFMNKVLASFWVLWNGEVFWIGPGEWTTQLDDATRISEQEAEAWPPPESGPDRGGFLPARIEVRCAVRDEWTPSERPDGLFDNPGTEMRECWEAGNLLATVNRHDLDADWLPEVWQFPWGFYGPEGEGRNLEN